MNVPVRKAAMLLIVTDSGLLMHLRDGKPGIPNPGCWAGFGGAVEGGETVEQALHRELLEEDLPGLKMSPFVRRAIRSHLLPVLAWSASIRPD
jgi:8-oxo-dGTP diphosphatase